ncbi:hypothetical protein UA08_06086 [Talaromyces atroroseus]|uniref:Uncharacterized protein n=1 Tax=Talaromyces atroroseus TaxID=1441469 RepID=A0A225AUG8_TALAT|nr:hypothetical protein UA08_06086 [Talaromyces atroroseus]OKL58586.1 hypothetical protein UA08_06086 [Talaromyces atroroseus]
MSTTEFPPQPYHTQSPSRSLKIAPKHWMSNTIQVTDAQDKDTILYTAKPSFLVSDLTIRKLPSAPLHGMNTDDSGAILADAEFHSFRRKIDISIHNHTITLPLKAKLNTETTFALPSLRNTQVTWRHDHHLSSSELLCLDEKNMCLAKITTPSWTLKHESQLDLFEGNVVSNRGFGGGDGSFVVDEIIATGLALLHDINRRRHNTAAVAWGAGGGGA